MEALKRLLMVSNLAELHHLEEKLIGAGYIPILYGTIAPARAYVTERGVPHLVLIDITLPDGSGLSFCREMQLLANVPIIVFSDQHTPGKAAQALQFADDYVRVPFETDEVMMRIRRLMSRVNDFSYALGPRVKVCDRLTVDYSARCIIVDDETRLLTPTENVLLHILMQNRGKVVEADSLIERTHFSGVGIHDRNALRVFIHRLRQKIERDPGDPQIILTKHGIGYTFAAEEDAA